MGEILVLVIVVVGVGVPASLLASRFIAVGHQRDLSHVPPTLLPVDGSVYANKLRATYGLAQRSVRVFERQLDHDSGLPFLSNEERHEIQAIVKTFYEEASQ